MQQLESIVLACAPNGARRTKSDHPALPEGPAEIAECAEQAMDAGAAMLHLHVRDAAGRHSLDAGLYREAIGEIERRVGDRLVIQITTESVGRYSPEDQITCIQAVRPEAVSIALREIVRTSEDIPRARRLHDWLDETRTSVQHILYEPREFDRWRALRRRGVLGRAPAFLLFVLGRAGTGPSCDPRYLLEFLDCLEPGEAVQWMVCAFGPAEPAAAALASVLGGHVRAGFENNLLGPDGAPAANNAALLENVAEIARLTGRRPIDGREMRAQSWMPGKIAA